MQVSLVLLYFSSALLLWQGCCAAVPGWRVVKNDATEIIPEYIEETPSPEEPIQLSNNSMNRAKHGGRRSANAASYGASELSCRELRSTRYITDGSCRSAKPVKELVCSGQCVPSHLLPNSILRGKWWRSSSTDYRCVPAHSRTQRVQLRCPDGNSRTYKIRVVTSCKCKRYSRHHNQSEVKEASAPKPRRNQSEVKEASGPKPRRNKKRSRRPQEQSKSPETGNSY